MHFQQFYQFCIAKENSQVSCLASNPCFSLFDIHRLEKGLKEILHYEAQKEALTLEEQEVCELFLG